MTVEINAIYSDTQWHSLRSKVVGASEAGALVGEHDYLSYWGLWARKSGLLPAPDDSGAMERGHRLEPVAVEMIRDRYPAWDIMVPRSHYADHEFGIGATPDLLALDQERGSGVIQIKSVASRIFRQSWRGDSDSIRVPIWIAIQALMEADLTGASWAYVAALVVDHVIDLHMIEIPLHPQIVDTIKTEALAFWRAVLAKQEPEPDFRRDHELIKAALRADDGSELDLSQWNELQDLLDRREAALAVVKEAKAEADACNAALLHRLGPAVRGTFPGGYVSAKTVNVSAHSVKASSYRKLHVVRQREEGASS
jgi:hypothetical protein